MAHQASLRAKSRTASPERPLRGLGAYKGTLPEWTAERSVPLSRVLGRASFGLLALQIVRSVWLRRTAHSAIAGAFLPYGFVPSAQTTATGHMGLRSRRTWAKPASCSVVTSAWPNACIFSSVIPLTSGCTAMATKPPGLRTRPTSCKVSSGWGQKGNELLA